MGGDGSAFITIIFFLLLFLQSSSSLPMCTDSRSPFPPDSPLSFCSGGGRGGVGCCNSTDDAQARELLTAMNITNSACSSLFKSILCSKCDSFSMDLFRGGSTPRLCNSTVGGPNSTQVKAQASVDFCSEVWSTCGTIPITDSPFSPTLTTRAGSPPGRRRSTLAEQWRTEADFCSAFGGGSGEGMACLGGDIVEAGGGEGPPAPVAGMCLEKIANGSYLNMAAHPDGSSRAFFSNQAGQVWAAELPRMGSGAAVRVAAEDPYLDITDLVHYDAAFGMMGMAFHPRFEQNGRLFASYNCDKAAWPGCAGKCSCNSLAGCDPAQLRPENGAPLCQYQSVISEFSANGTRPGSFLNASVRPVEVKRVFTMGLPFSGQHAGQILFGPEDGCLYFMMGDGGGKGGPHVFSQNKKSVLGKIMRLDVDRIPSAEEVGRFDLWGNYSIPPDNPFARDPQLLPEIWATGFRNPWRCSFDSKRPSYFVCADTGEDRYEEVDLVYKDGNYGWPIFEGPLPFENSTGEGVRPRDFIFPVLGYTHSDINNEGSASIMGGYFYRSTTDPCLYGRYVYGDLYARVIWAGAEEPEGSGNFTAKTVPFMCAADSPIECASVPGTALPSLGYVYSFGEDNSKDLYILTSSGVYRVVPPSRCGYACSKENTTAHAAGPPPSPPSTSTVPPAASLTPSRRCNMPLGVLVVALLLLVFRVSE